MSTNDSNLIFEQYKQVNEALGLGPNTPSIVTIKIGHTTKHPPRRTPGGTAFNAFSDEETHSECEEAKNGCTCGGCPECKKNAEDAENYAEDECGRSHSDEEVYIQAGDDAEESNCGCGQTPCMSQVEDDDDFDGEIDMARAELLKAAEYATKLFNHLANVGSLEGWTASKITKASDYLSSVYHALEYDALDANVEDEEDDIEIDEFDETNVAKKTGFA